MIDKKQLNEYEIKEFINYFGVETFTNEDLELWTNKKNNYIEFMDKYFLNKDNDVKYRDNILKIYYNLDFNERSFKINLPVYNFSDEELNGTLSTNKSKYGSSSVDTFRNPLFDLNDNLIGTVCFSCFFHTIKNDPILSKNDKFGLFIQDTVTYFIENNFIFPNFIDNDEDKQQFQTIDFIHSYGSRDGQTTFYEPGDIIIVEANSQNKKGLDRMSGFVCIYVTPDNKRNIILNFDKIKSTNFIPRQNYGRK